MFSNLVKYLGTAFDKWLTWGPHLNVSRRILNSRLRLIWPILKSKMPIKTKIILCKPLLRPVWTCGVQFWGGGEPSDTRVLFRHFNKFFFVASPMHLGTFEKVPNIYHLNVETIDQFVKKKTQFKFPSPTPSSLKSTDFQSFCCQLSGQPDPSI